MLINEVCKHTSLTKKAVEYYTGKGLVSPRVLGNGYRDYQETDMEILKQIGVLRRLDICMEDIREILQDRTGESLERAVAKREMETRRNVRKNGILRELCSGRTYTEVEEELQALEIERTIGERLIDAFPGYYGRFVSMHFSRFLDEAVKTEEQQKAYEQVLSFLDQMLALEIPEDVEQDMAKAVSVMNTEQIEDMLKSVRQSMENPDDFLSKNQETIEWYLAYRESEEYRNSSAGKWMEYMSAFQSTSGYTEVFLPAMKRLSPAYKKYCVQMEQADKKLLERYSDFFIQTRYPNPTRSASPQPMGTDHQIPTTPMAGMEDRR